MQEVDIRIYHLGAYGLAVGTQHLLARSGGENLKGHYDMYEY